MSKLCITHGLPCLPTLLGFTISTIILSHLQRNLPEQHTLLQKQLILPYGNVLTLRFSSGYMTPFPLTFSLLSYDVMTQPREHGNGSKLYFRTIRLREQPSSKKTLPVPFSRNTIPSTPTAITFNLWQTGLRMLMPRCQMGGSCYVSQVPCQRRTVVRLISSKIKSPYLRSKAVDHG